MDSSSARLPDRLMNKRSVIPDCNRSANAIRHFHFIDPTSQQIAGRYRVLYTLQSRAVLWSLHIVINYSMLVVA